MKLKYYRLFIYVLIITAVFAATIFLVKRVYPLKYSDIIWKYSGEYSLDPYLVTAVIKAESNFRSSVRSGKNAVGLMQVTEDTAQWIAQQLHMEEFKYSQLNDPEINIKMGCWYLNNLRQEFKEDIVLILAAYNAGRGNVKSWLKNPDYSKDGKSLYYIPYKETDKYIKRVKVNYNIYKWLYKAKEQ